MSINSERGTSLIEALIALILVSILVQGALHLTSRATSVHTEQQMLTIALSQMRAAITSESICDPDPIMIQLPGNVSLPAQVQGCDTTTVTIDGTPISNIPTPVGISIDSPLLGGQVVVGGTWRN